jgi:hypothetical protein
MVGFGIVFAFGAGMIEQRIFGKYDRESIAVAPS